MDRRQHRRGRVSLAAPRSREAERRPRGRARRGRRGARGRRRARFEQRTGHGLCPRRREGPGRRDDGLRCACDAPAAGGELGSARELHAGRDVSEGQRDANRPAAAHGPRRLRPRLQPDHDQADARRGESGRPGHRRPRDARCAGARTVRVVVRHQTTSGSDERGRAEAACGVHAPMKITSFEEFKELSLRGTFVPVVKEIVADLLTPVSAFLKIAEHADYAFLLESVEGGEHVGRYSFLGKDPFLILTSKAGKTIIERGGTTTESGKPFVDTLRRLMADFQSPFVPDLPRFTGGAVGYLGYGASTWFEPVLGDLGKSDDGADKAGFMLFDTVLAFDHVQHRILIIANARITADDDLESLYQSACAKIQFLERELERGLSQTRKANGKAL